MGGAHARRLRRSLSDINFSGLTLLRLSRSLSDINFPGLMLLRLSRLSDISFPDLRLLRLSRLSDINFSGLTLLRLSRLSRYRPFHWGGRFSAKAMGPSLASSVALFSSSIRRPQAMASFRVKPNPRTAASLIPCSASGA